MNAIGINLWNWENLLGPACAGLPAKVREMGFDAIELPMTAPACGEELEKEVADSGLEVSLCASLGVGKDLSHFDEAPRRAAMDYLTACLETGARLGAKVLCGPLYTGGGKRHRLPDDEKKREWDYAVKGLRALAVHARSCGVRLAIEPLNRYRTSVINTTDQAIALVKDINEDNVGIHYDTYQACLEEKDLCASLQIAVQSGKLLHFHACANNRGAPGEGIIPWNTVLDLLTDGGYQGHITMETFAQGGLDDSFIRVHEAPDVLAANGLRFLRSYFS